MDPLHVCKPSNCGSELTLLNLFRSGLHEGSDHNWIWLWTWIILWIYPLFDEPLYLIVMGEGVGVYLYSLRNGPP